MRSRLVLAEVPLALVACATAPVPQPAAPVFSHTEVLTKLDSPWDRALAGGRIRFSPGDGHLCVTTGNTHNGVVAQSPTLIGGKVLRIDRDGKAAPGHGAPAGFDPRIYTYGHRNRHGIAFRPGTNQAVHRRERTLAQR